MIIFIDGADGVGKTTLGTALAKWIGCDYVDVPLHAYIEDGQNNNYNIHNNSFKNHKKNHKSSFPDKPTKRKKLPKPQPFVAASVLNGEMIYKNKKNLQCEQIKTFFVYLGYIILF